MGHGATLNPRQRPTELLTFRVFAWQYVRFGAAQNPSRTRASAPMERFIRFVLHAGRRALHLWSGHS